MSTESVVAYEQREGVCHRADHRDCAALGQARSGNHRAVTGSGHFLWVGFEVLEVASEILDVASRVL